MCCTTPIELANYSATHITRKDLCCYCADEDAVRDADVMKAYRVVLPMCTNCVASGKPVIKRPQRKTNSDMMHVTFSVNIRVNSKVFK
jgi:hypothetical protein